jgi:signal transduction histidine kinase
MPRTLYARLAAALVALFVAIGTVYTLVSGSVIQRYLLELTQHFNRDLARRLVVDGNLVVKGRLDAVALQATFSAYMDINPSIEIYLLDRDGLILSYSAEPGRVKRRHVDLGPIRAFLDGVGFPLLGDDPRAHDRRKPFSVTPVPSAAVPEGYLYVVLRGEEFDSAEQAVQESYVLRLSAWALAGSLGFGLLAGLLLFHLLTRRLQRLASVMGGFQERGFTHYTPFTHNQGRRKDEVDELGAAFDGMAQRIVDQLAQLKSQDRLRRDMVAQVSHDLRTPLAALHGYLETLFMKAEELNNRERHEYLTAALRQSSHLKRMLEDLFELAHLEARDTPPHREPFAVAELIQDVVQKYRLGARCADVKLDFAPPQASPFVLADVALTERVLDNLIGNALDHTPAEGMVSLTLDVYDDHVWVSVRDTGGGVPAADLPHIFQAFYRSQNTRSSKGHAGLGLAIAKRILDLQGGEIAVFNCSTGGTAFCFSLAMHKG